MASIQKYGNDYLVKTGSGSRNSSGPSGRRKMRPRNIMAQALADAAAKYSIVLWCSDQAHHYGTSARAKFDSDNHGHMKEAWASVRKDASDFMSQERAA